MTSSIGLRLDSDVKKMALQAYANRRDKYNSPSHFVRCAIIQQYRREVKEQ